jgi:hypothetical protein
MTHWKTGSPFSLNQFSPEPAHMSQIARHHFTLIVGQFEFCRSTAKKGMIVVPFFSTISEQRLAGRLDPYSNFFSNPEPAQTFEPIPDRCWVGGVDVLFRNNFKHFYST